jgi:pimeloyl-ACP methyl ester carboxylesterase
VIDRLEHHGLSARAIELFDPAPEDASVESLAEALVAETSPDDVLVCHGTAVPVVLAAAAHRPPRALVVTNGALGALDPFTRGICSAARLPGFARTTLRPEIWNRWLSSSAGLRRTVVNPYVMDRDTVVALTRPYLATLQHRQAVGRFFSHLPEAISEPPSVACSTLLLWGDEDPLYPAHIADTARQWIPQATVRMIPGGQHHHPAERPWAMADELASWFADL